MDALNTRRVGTYKKEAMQAIPGNKHFQGDVEYGTLINFYFEPWKHLLGQGLLFGALQSNAIQGIVLSAQAIDHLFVTAFGKSCGLSFSKGWVCSTSHTDTLGNYLPSPFGNEFVLFTLGFVVVFFLTVPLGLVNLDDNIWVQYVAASFPNLGNDSVLIHLLGGGKPVVLTAITVYAFGFVMLIPSIPVSLIISRENLVQNKVLSDKVASAVAFITPWIIAIPFLTGDNLQLFQVITSAVFVATSNFILPMLIYFKCVEFRKTYNTERKLTDHQKELLRAIHRASSKVSRYLDNLDKPEVKVTEPSTEHANTDEALLATQNHSMYKTGNNHSNTSVYSLELLPSQRKEILAEVSKQQLLAGEESSKTLDSTEVWGNEDVPDPDMDDIIARKETQNMGTMGSKSRMGTLSGIFTFGRKRSESPVETAGTSSRAHLSPNDIPVFPDTSVRIPLNDMNENTNARNSQNEVYLATLQRNIPKEDLSRIGTLPMHPKFRTPAFRTVPSWLPFKGEDVAKIVLVITSIITVMTIAVNIYQLATPN
ncbi:hypothetical protein HDV06_001427 [Boothiomyces sp. JEL0866]|nr:hypothetical protein HDV06_001427 [Boothiomyces sp. JEL0866]